MQIGPGIEISMRSNMLDKQLVVSNRMLRSAAAMHEASSGNTIPLRARFGAALHRIGTSLAGRERQPAIGDCSLVNCAS